MNNYNDDFSEYINKDLNNPKYLYFGSAHPVDFENVKMVNKDNTNFSMYLTSYHNVAAANAFAEKIAEKNLAREYNMHIYPTSIPILEAYDIEDIEENEQAYLYVFQCPEDVKDKGNFKYLVEKPLIPIKTEVINYKDYKVYYRIVPINQKTK